MPTFYRDPTTGQPLPRPQWWVGTSNFTTSAQWEAHLRKGRKIYGWLVIGLTLVGLVLFVSWPAPGFGQGIGMIMWLLAVLMTPWYFLYRNYYKQYFGGVLR